MTTPAPGSDTGPGLSPTDAPIESRDDGLFRHDGSWNSYQFDPPLTHEDALALTANAQELGYRLLFRRADYSMEEVQAQLVDRGPSSFLNLTWVQEDIAPKAPPPTAEARMATRMKKLAPTSSLIITDPFLFTSSRKADSEQYAASLTNMLTPALVDGLHITAIVHPRQNDPTVRSAVERGFRTVAGRLALSVIEADDFHDRFWIADRQRGIVIGASLNKIGRRIFFVDELNTSDVAAVLREVDKLIDT